MVNTVKFSEFSNETLTDGAAQVVGLEAGVNIKSTRFLTWTTSGRPSSPFNGLLGINTDLQEYEYWDAVLGAWTQLTTNINILAILASHAVNEGASLIGLQNQSHVSNKFVQDLANATFIAQTDNGTLQNGQFLGSLTTGIVKNTTSTGVLTISAPLTSIDGLTTSANQMIYTTGSNTYATTSLTPFSRGLFADADAAAWRASLGVTPGGGTVTSISAGNGITLSPSPITSTGSVSLTVPVVPILGGTGLVSYTLGDVLYASSANVLSALAGNTSGTKMFLSQTGTGIVSAAPAWSTVSASDIVSGAALTKTDDTNVTLSLGGSPSTALLSATSLTLGWTGTLSSTRGGLGLSNPTAHGILVGEGASAVNPIVLSSGQLLIGSTGVDPVAAAINSGTGILVGNGAGSITVTLANANNNTIKSNISGISAAPVDNTLTAIIDSAIANTQGDILYRNATSWVALPPSTAGFLLQTGGAAANPSWVAQAAPSSAALTKTDDTNVTLTLGGSPNTALLAATSLTLGWTGQLGLTRGGTNASLTASNGGIVYSTASALAILSGTATAGQILRSGSSAAPSWSTATYPATAGTSGNVLTSDGTNWNSSAPAGSSTSVIVDDTTTNATMYPTWVTASTGSLPLKVSSTKLSFNPSTGTMTLAGALSSSTSITSSAGLNLLTFNYTPSAVNYIGMVNNTTGSAVAIFGVGSDTNVTLQLSGQGTGGAALQGTGTNNNATAGFVGEYVESVIAAGSAVTVTNSTATNITTISLTAGDWDVWGNITYPSVGGTAPQQLYAWTSSTSASIPDGSLINGISLTVAGGVLFGGNGVNAPTRRFSLPSTTTIYLTGYAVATAGNATGCGRLCARRVR